MLASRRQSRSCPKRSRRTKALALPMLVLILSSRRMQLVRLAREKIQLALVHLGALSAVSGTRPVDLVVLLRERKLRALSALSLPRRLDSGRKALGPLAGQQTRQRLTPGLARSRPGKILAVLAPLRTSQSRRMTLALLLLRRTTLAPLVLRKIPPRPRRVLARSKRVMDLVDSALRRTQTTQLKGSALSAPPRRLAALADSVEV